MVNSEHDSLCDSAQDCVHENDGKNVHKMSVRKVHILHIPKTPTIRWRITLILSLFPIYDY